MLLRFEIIFDEDISVVSLSGPQVPAFLSLYYQNKSNTKHTIFSSVLKRTFRTSLTFFLTNFTIELDFNLYPFCAKAITHNAHANNNSLQLSSLSWYDKPETFLHFRMQLVSDKYCVNIRRYQWKYVSGIFLNHLPVRRMLSNYSKAKDSVLIQFTRWISLSRFR